MVSTTKKEDWGTHLDTGRESRQAVSDITLCPVFRGW